MSAVILHFVAVDTAPNRIREHRLAAKMSQQVLADIVGVSKPTISDLELGNIRLDVSYLRRISHALGLTSADLLPRSDHPFSLSATERELIERLRAADEDLREKVLQANDALLPPLPQPDDERQQA